MGTPPIASECLKALHEDEHFEIVGVVSQPDRPSGRKLKFTPSAVKAYATEQGLSVLTPEKAKGEAFFDWVTGCGAEAVVVVAYGQILTQKFLDLFPTKVVNVHASLLPKWRGAAPIQRSVMAGDSITGVSLQVMTKKLDAGDVIGERSLTIEPEWSALDLHNAMIPLAQELLTVDFMDYLRGNLAASPQDESLVTYAHKIEKSESEIDWSWPADKIHNHIRGMLMGPGTYTLVGGKKLKLHQTSVKKQNQKAPAGQVVAVAKTELLVATGDGCLSLEVVQPESKPKMGIEDYLKGHQLNKGDRLG
jgi:methionyl-tRNA formyltransferase